MVPVSPELCLSLLTVWLRQPYQARAPPHIDLFDWRLVDKICPYLQVQWIPSRWAFRVFFALSRGGLGYLKLLPVFVTSNHVYFGFQNWWPLLRGPLPALSFRFCLSEVVTALRQLDVWLWLDEQHWSQTIPTEVTISQEVMMYFFLRDRIH